MYVFHRKSHLVEFYLFLGNAYIFIIIILLAKRLVALNFIKIFFSIHL